MNTPTARPENEALLPVEQADRWAWWAGDNEDEYRLAGPCNSRKAAISEAYGDTEPGDTIYLIEAIREDEDDGEGFYQFVATRNRSSVIRREDLPLWVWRARAFIHRVVRFFGGPNHG